MLLRLVKVTFGLGVGGVEEVGVCVLLVDSGVTGQDGPVPVVPSRSDVCELVSNSESVTILGTSIYASA